MSRVTDEQVAVYRDHVESLARRYVGFAEAELDDLVQEGLIAVWQAIGRGLRPSSEVIEGRMIDWLRYLRRLQHNDGIAYDLLLPIEDYAALDE